MVPLTKVVPIAKTVPKRGSCCGNENGSTVQPFRLHFFLSVMNIVNAIKQNHTLFQVSKAHYFATDSPRLVLGFTALISALRGIDRHLDQCQNFDRHLSAVGIDQWSPVTQGCYSPLMELLVPIWSPSCQTSYKDSSQKFDTMANVSILCGNCTCMVTFLIVYSLQMCIIHYHTHLILN